VIATLEELGGLHARFTWCGLAVPLRPIVIEELVDELLETVSCPVALPVADGLNVSVTLIDCPGFNVAGRLTAEAENPVPVTPIEFTVSAAVPVELIVTV